MTARAAAAALAAVLCVSAAWAAASTPVWLPAPQSAQNQPSMPSLPEPAWRAASRKLWAASWLPAIPEALHDPAIQVTYWVRATLVLGVPGYGPPVYAPSGHLGDWLNQHRNLPVQEQERMLRGDPSFRRLNPADQQRLMQQLHQVNQMPEEQRQRRLARAEIIEHLPPQERMRINLSARRWADLPPERQAMMKSAFQDCARFRLISDRWCSIPAATRASSPRKSAASSPICCASSLTSRRGRGEFASPY